LLLPVEILQISLTFRSSQAGVFFTLFHSG
jgi:hypothetical protein